MTGEQLRKWRKAMGFKQSAAAQELGVCARTYQRFEQATTVPKLVELAVGKLADDKARFLAAQESMKFRAVMAD